MIKTTAIITTMGALSIGASAPNQTSNGVPASSINPVKSIEVQLSHLDFQAEKSGVQTKIMDGSEFALRLTLKSGHVINVRF
jgi:hypothetical protein